MREEKDQVVYLSFDEAEKLVYRISARAEQFNYNMCSAEIEAMANLLSEIGVKVSDLICENNLADNYAINAHIASEEEMEQYETDKDDCLFSWTDDGGLKQFCVSW